MSYGSYFICRLLPSTSMLERYLWNNHCKWPEPCLPQRLVPSGWSATFRCQANFFEIHQQCTRCVLSQGLTICWTLLLSLILCLNPQALLINLKLYFIHFTVLTYCQIRFMSSSENRTVRGNYTWIFQWFWAFYSTILWNWTGYAMYINKCHEHTAVSWFWVPKIYLSVSNTFNKGIEVFASFPNACQVWLWVIFPLLIVGFKVSLFQTQVLWLY